MDNLGLNTCCMQAKTIEITENKKKFYIDLIRSFFKQPFVYFGSFIHLIDKDRMSKNKNQEEGFLDLKNTQEMNGYFTIKFDHPISFKFKYIHPNLVQITKMPGQSTYYKVGQFKAHANDFIHVPQANLSRPKLLDDKFSFVSLFNKPVDNWVHKIHIISCKEENDKIQITFKIQNKRMILQFSNSKPFYLLKWQFCDVKGKINQLILNYTDHQNKDVHKNALYFMPD